MVRKTKKKPLKGHNGKAPNGLAPADNVRHHHSKISTAQKKLDEAKAALRRVEKSAAQDGIVLRDYREAIANEKRSEKDLFTRHNNVGHYMRSIGISYGRKLPLIKAEEPNNSPDAVEKRASDMGYDDGIAGRPINESYEPGSPAGQRYLASYKDGNNELAKSSFQQKA